MPKYEYQELTPGLAIYKQKRSNNYYIRLRVKDETGKAFEFRKTLSVSDKNEATQKAWSYYFANKDKLSPEIFTKTQKSKVRYLADELIKHFEGQSKKIYKDYKRVLENEVLPEFGNYNIKELERKMLKKFISKHAKSTTQQRIRKTTFKHLFDLAVDHNLMKEYEIPSIPAIEADTDEVRSMFSDEHLELFNKKYNEFIGASRKDVTKRYRVLFQQYMIFLLETGIRPGEEALHITLNDFGFNKIKNVYTVKITKGKIHSKKKSSFREIPLSSGAIDAIESILKSLWGWHFPLSTISTSKKIALNSTIFRLPDIQNKRPQYEKVFEQLCNYCKLDYKDCSYSLYSYRHTYITRKLVEGVDAYLVATQCGTSVEMLQRNYSKLTAVMRSSELVDVSFDHGAPF